MNRVKRFLREYLIAGVLDESWSGVVKYFAGSGLGVCKGSEYSEMPVFDKHLRVPDAS